MTSLWYVVALDPESGDRRQVWGPYEHHKADDVAVEKGKHWHGRLSIRVVAIDAMNGGGDHA
jgi:hypothetical protein